MEETLSPADRASLSLVGIVVKAHGDSGGPVSPATSGGDWVPPVPSAQLRPPFCAPGGQTGSH